jgi:hypothetical protein
MRKTTFEPIFTKTIFGCAEALLRTSDMLGSGPVDEMAGLFFVCVNHTAGFLGRAPWPAPRCHAQLQYGHMADI